MEADESSQMESSALDQARLELARCHLSQSSSLATAINQVAHIAAKQLNVERVSVWVYLNEGQSIRCEYLYHRDHNFKAGVIFHASDFPEYFKALNHQRVVAVRDIEGDPFTEEFRDPYFRPLGITSMLDAPIYRDGKRIGIVCHEHIGVPRHWNPLEKEFAGSVADTLSRLYEEDARHFAENMVQNLEHRMDQMERMGALGQLAAGIAHDFRNVLSAAIGAADLMRDSLDGTGSQSMQDLVKLNERLQTALQQGLKLTEELLDYGLGRKQKPRVLEMKSHLEGFVSMLSMALGPKVQVLVEIGQPSMKVFADPSQWDRAILNLAFNAKDAMPNGGTFSLKAELLETAFNQQTTQSEVMVEIKDTGVGVDEETRKRMFEPYFTTKEKKGTGLGFAFVQKVVHHMGGRIEVESELGKGLAVRLILPCIG